MGVALALSERGRGRTFPNPNVGCVLVKDGRVIGRGWTQPGGRPHAEQVALAQAGEAARGATAYVTLEPCAHDSIRGPACAPSLAKAGVARVVVGAGDHDPRTCGRGLHALRAADIEVVEGVRSAEARRAMAGFLARQALGRPHVTLKLALSLDGCIALANGASRWITGESARRHAHLERARHEAILVGRETWEADAPGLDVRVAGLEERSPLRVILSKRTARPERVEGPSFTPSGGPGGTEKKDGASTSSARTVLVITSPDDIAALPADHLLVEGGAQTASSFLKADLVDRLLLYTAPILIGGKPALGDLGLTNLADAHGRWTRVDTRMLGVDRLDVYERNRCLPA